ncbi:MAG: CDP-diacylglycerol--glycerol-3-phosphate 3-phosphatidyltransferase [Acholeplasmataceae bacterium]
MTTANKLTLIRVIIIPIMITLLYIEPLKTSSGFFGLSWGGLWFAILFVIAGFTDLLDGFVARKYNQITTFGKFLDPIADKILVITALLYLLTIMPLRVTIWAVMVIIVREFLVTGVRLLAVERGVVISASPYGKLKTASTMFALFVLLFNDFGLNPWIGNVAFYVALILTVLSGIDYLVKNRQMILVSI